MFSCGKKSEEHSDKHRLLELNRCAARSFQSFDSAIKEKDVELQHLANTLKNLQRAKHDVEDNLNRSLREKDSIISQLQLSLEGKTKDMEVSFEITTPPSTNSFFLSSEPNGKHGGHI